MQGKVGKVKVRKKLGEMLVEAKLLTDEQLNQALTDHKKSGLKLGKYLMQQGTLTEYQIISVLSQQLKIEKYHPDKYPVDINLVQIVPSDIAQKYQVAPLKKKGHLLTIAMVDPVDINAQDAIEMLTNHEVEPVVCTERELNQLIGQVYGMQSGIGGVLESIEELKIDSGADADAIAGPSTDDLQVSSLQGMAEEAPIVRLVNSIISQAVRESASDIHLSPQLKNVQVRFRIDGRLHEVPAPPKAMFLPIISRIKILANMDIATSRIPQDGRFTVKMENKEINVRVSSIPTIYGENLVLRLLDMGAGVYSLDRLGMSKEDKDKVDSIINKPYGMILSTGPTGSGKSTSLYAIIKEINRADIHIITLEDPVEYRVERVRQVQLNRKVGMTFASGLRSILRQDPDVIMVGEIRDGETAGIAVQAALTGHRVLSTVHTNDSAGAITRLLDMGIEPFLVSSVLLVSFAQRLVRTICTYCKEPYRPNEKVVEAWGLNGVKDGQFQRGRGCPACMGTGYRGRTGLFEILLNDDLIQDMIIKGASAQEIHRAAKQAGRLRTLREDAVIKVLNGVTTLEEAASAVMV
ncbi:MAG TPA: ATPase, T2SS/T4P/T4SS family [Syntrophales bacterium]|nr:ATPase, T2SS/T4P/T4SS family [Syntrophales bacterium]HPI56396.1 ATPase, T2SS/T4P/T4SS family [Syntrophales bacterium]